MQRSPLEVRDPVHQPATNDRIILSPAKRKKCNLNVDWAIRMRTRMISKTTAAMMVKPQFSAYSETKSLISGKYQMWKRAMTTTKAFQQTRLYHATSGGAMGDGRISSPRASRAVGLLPTYLADARAVEQYSPSTPNGALQLSVAENKMLEDLLIPSLTEFYSTQAFPADAIYYQPTHGRESFRIAMAAYFEGLLGLSKPMDEDGIVVGAGCNAVLENLCICLAEPGEGVMIPTPYCKSQCIPQSR